jgi:kumamolisin
VNAFSRQSTILAALAAVALLACPHPSSAASAATVRDVGRLPSGTRVDLVLGLRLRNEATLDALVAAQSNRQSPLFRHFLKPAQLRDSFGTTSAEYARTLATLRSRGFSVLRTDALRTSVDVAAPAQTVERYFATTLHAVESARGTGYTSVSPIHIPAELAADVAAVGGLHSALFQTAYEAQVGYGSHAPTGTQPAQSGLAPLVGSTPQYGPDGGYGPQSVEGAFDFPIRHGYFGNGVTVADVIDGAFSEKADIAPFLTEFNVKRSGPPTTYRLVDGGCGGKQNCADSFSAAIDAQNIIGTAPGVSYVVYELPSLSDAGIIDGMNAVVSDDTADVVNFAVGGCETALGEASYLIDQAYKLGSAEGITFETVTFGGSDPCGVPFHTSVQAPADSPHTATIGGVDSFTDQFGNVTSPAIADTSTGGGHSILFAVPPFQAGIKRVASSGRNLPDIGGPAAINGVGTSIYFFGVWIGGSVFVNNAPVAGALAEVAQVNGARLGRVDTSLYELYKAQGYTTGLYRDVTLGCNGGDGYGPFCSAVGFDLVTGLGSPDFYRIATSL